MPNRFVLENLRQSPLRTSLSVLATGVEVAIILTLVGIRTSRPDVVRILVAGYASILLGFVLGVSFLVVMMGRYAAVREKSQEIGILRALGASSGYIHNVLFQETLLIAVFGTIVGIVMTFGIKWLIMYALSDFLIEEIVYKWWPIAGAISVIGALPGAFIPARKAIRQDLTRALSNDE